MPSHKRWKFGLIEVVTADVTFLAREVATFVRLERTHQLRSLLEKWLGDPLTRAAVLDIEREVTLRNILPISVRPLGRENDHAIIAAIQSAFLSQRIHVLRLEKRLSTAPLAAYGQTWKFERAEIVQSDAGVRVSKLADYYIEQTAENFSKALEVWTKRPRDREVLLDVYKTITTSETADELRPEDLLGNEEVFQELLEAWTGERIYLLQLRFSGGAGSEDEPAEDPAADAAKLPKRSNTVKTWIEIVLVDDKGKPVPGEKYRLKITDGSTREGSLDDDGRVRVNGIDPGSCEVSFPNLDGKEWHAA